MKEFLEYFTEALADNKSLGWYDGDGQLSNREHTANKIALQKQFEDAFPGIHVDVFVKKDGEDTVYVVSLWKTSYQVATVIEHYNSELETILPEMQQIVQKHPIQ